MKMKADLKREVPGGVPVDQVGVTNEANGSLFVQDQVEPQGATIADVTHYEVHVNGVRLHYVKAGKGDELAVIIHGCPQTWYEWRHIIPVLAERYTVVAPDLRGLGDSSRPLDGYDKRNVAHDLRELVAKLGFKKAHIVGHDMGGAVAHAYADAYPDQTLSLAILEMMIPGLGMEEALREAGVWHIDMYIEPQIPEMLIQGRQAKYLPWFYKKFAHRSEVFTEAEITEYLRTYRQQETWVANLEHYRAFPGDAAYNREYAKELKMPVLALGGEYLMGEGPMMSLRRVAPQTVGGVIADSGHWVNEEQPDAVIERLIWHFSGQQGSAPAGIQMP